jgi:hypothetical protein
MASHLVLPRDKSAAQHLATTLVGCFPGRAPKFNLGLKLKQYDFERTGRYEDS